MTTTCGICGYVGAEVGMVRGVPRCTKCKNDYYRAKRGTVTVTPTPDGSGNGTARRDAGGWLVEPDPEPPELSCCATWTEHWKQGSSHILDGTP